VKAEPALTCWLWVTPTSPGFSSLLFRAYRPSRWQRILFRSRLRDFRRKLLVMGFAVTCKTVGVSSLGSFGCWLGASLLFCRKDIWGCLPCFAPERHPRGQGRLWPATSVSDVSSCVVGNADYLSTRWGVDEDIPLRPDATSRLRVKNHDPANALLGTAGNSLAEIRPARLRAIEFAQKFRVQFPSKKRGSCHGQVSSFGPESAPILLQILACALFGQSNLIRCRVVRIDCKIALVCFGGIESATCRKKHCKNKQKR